MRNDSQRTGTSRRARIATISQELARLTQELKTLLQIDSSDDESAKDTHFEIGDTVVINNSYRGLKGASGKIVAVTKHQVEIRLPNNKVVRRKKSNVRKTQE